jgi:hypothetical protein
MHFGSNLFQPVPGGLIPHLPGFLALLGLAASLVDRMTRHFRHIGLPSNSQLAFLLYCGWGRAPVSC